MNRWQQLFDKIALPYVDDPRRVSLPNQQTFDEFEERTSITLPSSYCEFMSFFGPGEIAGEFRLLGPGYANSNTDLESFNSWFQKGIRRSRTAEQFEDPDLAKRMIIFCLTFRGDYFSWDPEDVTDSSANEYSIHLLRHEMDATELIAHSFADFVSNICLGDGYFEKYSLTGDRTLEGPREVFEHALGKRRKKD
ncbi:MAG: SMI1/KNR4 family protein [Planctomycetaceae bacterium]|nr:SMI1/KNR4 family protein [Planctomycetaceae bacterium]